MELSDEVKKLERLKKRARQVKELTSSVAFTLEGGVVPSEVLEGLNMMVSALLEEADS